MKKLRKIFFAFTLIGTVCLMMNQWKSKAAEEPEKVVWIDGVEYVSNGYPDEGISPTEYFIGSFKQAYDEQGKPLYTDIIIKDEINGLPVIMVNGSCFSKHSEIKSIVFPKYCKCITAFSQCNGLQELSFPDSVEHISGFDRCINLEKVKLPSNLKYLDGFSYCTSLKRISIPKRVKRIGGSSFEGCTLLEEIRFENPNVEKIKFFGKCFQSTAIVNLASAKGEPVVVGDKVLLDSAGLQGKVNLSGDKIRAIASYAFSGNRNFRIRRLKMDGVEYIGEKAFYQSHVSRIWLNNIKKVEKYAFKKSDLVAVHINNIEQFEKSVFAQCKRLMRCNISNVKMIPQLTFNGCDKLKKVTLNEGTAQIGERCFARCKNLKTLIIESNKRIQWDGKEIFKKCDNLKKIAIKSNKVSSTIKNVKFPKGVVLDVPNGKWAKYRKYVDCKVI